MEVYVVQHIFDGSDPDTTIVGITKSIKEVRRILADKDIFGEYDYNPDKNQINELINKLKETGSSDLYFDDSQIHVEMHSVT